MIERVGRVLTVSVLVPAMLAVTSSAASAQELTAADYVHAGARAVQSLRPARGEEALVRHDPEVMPGLTEAIAQALERAGVIVHLLPWSSSAGFDETLRRSSIYVFLPFGRNSRSIPAQFGRVTEWMSTRGGRQLHFHWGNGTVREDGLSAPHTPAHDRMYLEALEINQGEFQRRANELIEALRVGEVRVTTPAGTDLRFQAAGQPFNTQDADASRERTSTRRMRIDAEIELPAGALRVAPLLESVHGVIALPRMRLDEVTATDVRIELVAGRVARLTASSQEAALLAHFQSLPGLTYFRDFGIGLNPKLRVVGPDSAIPYYGFNEGGVRLGLGNNTDYGGRVDANGIRIYYFANATVTAAARTLVHDGNLVPPADDRSRKVDQTMGPFDSVSVPGASVTVIANGKVILAKSYGMANIADGIAATPRTNYRLASMTKQMTAVAAMLLINDGKLRYETRLTDVFPEFPGYGKAITIRHLLTHTSGLVEYGDLLGPRATPVNDEDVLRLLSTRDSTLFPPGTRWRYSNSGYAVLATIVTKVAGVPFEQFLRQRMFTPLGMATTVAPGLDPSSVSNRAIGHTFRGVSYLQTDQSLTSMVSGDGSVYSSITDLARWNRALAGSQLLTPADITRTFARTARIDSANYYGFGWFIDERAGLRRVWHGGSSVGFTNAIEHYPDAGLTVIVLTNKTSSQAGALAERIADLYLRRN